ncbi:hypothetical protein EXIGLDRAFT_577075, partial [Exidia glandulosa HHB12029]
MCTADWWAEMQGYYPEDITINPMLVTGDVTHVTNFSGDGKMHPIFVSSGHIDKDIRNQPSKRAFMIVALLPVPKFAKTKFANKTQARDMPGRLRERLYHLCLTIVFQTAFTAARVPVYMADCDGNVRKEIILPAALIHDMQERNISACLNAAWCTFC